MARATGDQDHARDEPAWSPTARFNEALKLAVRLHAFQSRKGSTIPYVSHLLAVAGLVIEDGGSEDEAIAALLHDAVEDQGGAPTLARIEEQFGPSVAHIVDGCSETDQTPKPPWPDRKKRYLDHLRTADTHTLRVALADKLHNARAMLRDRRGSDDSFWTRFNAPRDAQAAYFRSLITVFRGREATGEFTTRFLDEFEDVVVQLFGMT